MNGISKVLVANRGEIAVRVIRACKELGIQSVLAVSDADRETLGAKMADRVVCIGSAKPAASYLKVDTIIAAALGTGADAIHPGYGFLAEQPEMPEMCSQYNLRFIGPKAENIRQMGNKLVARTAVQSLGVPVIPGSKKANNHADAVRLAKELGFPVLLKSAAGGGGRGIRIVNNQDELKAAFAESSNEALSSFGDETLYLERYIRNARHIEVQLLADSFGNAVHLGERDCSLQRRYQKIIEESPAAFISPVLRKEICEAAVVIAKAIHYEGAGTIEFIYDKDEEKFYFMEMNTRIQVEHPVSEMITGVDIVKEQINIAAGNPLSFTQADVKFSGHAIECRVNAESAARGFQPSPGRIKQWESPQGEGIRVDSHCYSGYFVPPYYDSLLAKTIVRGQDRLEAIDRMQNSLQQFVVDGIDTSIPFLQFLISRPEYVSGNINTRWVESILNDFIII